MDSLQKSYSILELQVREQEKKAKAEDIIFKETIRSFKQEVLKLQREIRNLKDDLEIKQVELNALVLKANSQSLNN